LRCAASGYTACGIEGTPGFSQARDGLRSRYDAAISRS